MEQMLEASRLEERHLLKLAECYGHTRYQPHSVTPCDNSPGPRVPGEFSA